MSGRAVPNGDTAPLTLYLPSPNTDRSQKSIGLLTGPPSFEPVSGFDKEEADSSNQTRVFKYSPDGSIVAMAMDQQ